MRRSSIASAAHRLLHRERPGQVYDILFLLLLCVTVFLAGFHTLVNSDYWFHLRGGASVANGHIPRFDTYSYPSAGREYVDLHWLFQWLLYQVHRVGGTEATIWLKCLVLLLTFGILYRLACRDAPRSVAGGVTILGVILASERFQVRPEILSYLGLAVTLWLAQRHIDGSKRAWFFFPLVFLLWVNVEGLFVLGFLALGAHVLARPKDRRLWLALGLSLLSILANPYFLKGALHPLVLYTRINGSLPIYSASIGEFIPPIVWNGRAFAVNDGISHTALYVFPATLILLAGALIAQGRRPRWVEILILVPFLFLAFRARRNLAPFAIVTIPILSHWLGRIGSGTRVADRWRVLPRNLRRLFRIAATSLLLLGIVLYDLSLATDRAYVWMGSARSCGSGQSTVYHPEGATRFLREHGIGGPIFSDLSTGSYLIWGYPEEPVFIDGRLEVHDLTHFADDVALQQGGEAWLRADARWHFNAAVLLHVSAEASSGRVIDEAEWGLVYLDSTAAVYLRKREQNEGLLAKLAYDDRRLAHDFPTLAPQDTLPGDLVSLPSVWQRYVAREPYPWPEVNLGQFFFRRGAMGLAAAQFCRAVEKAPIYASPRVLLANALIQLGRTGDASRVLQPTSSLLLTSSERDPLALARADLLLASERPRDAVDAYVRYLEEAGRGPHSAVTLVNLATARLEAGDPSGAIGDLRETLSYNPNYAVAYLTLGQVEEALGDSLAALEAYRRCQDLGIRSDEISEAIERLSRRTSSGPDSY